MATLAWLTGHRCTKDQSGKKKHLQTINPQGYTQGQFLNISVDDLVASKANKNEPLLLEIHIVRQWPPALLTHIYIDGHEIDATHLDERLSGTDFKLRRWRSMREVLTIFLTKYNDSIADHALAISSSFLVYLFVFHYLKLQYNLFRLNRSRNPQQLVLKRYRPDNQNQKISMELMESRWDKESRFAATVEVIGPSIGFLFTVTSLISALAPLAGPAPELSGFLNAIRIALISTFLGLIARIIAIFIQRANDEFFVLECQAIGHPKNTEE